MLLAMLLLACDSSEEREADQALCDLMDGSIHFVDASAQMDDDQLAQFHIADHAHEVTLLDKQGWVWAQVDAQTSAELHISEPGAVRRIFFDGVEQELSPTGEQNEACPDDLGEIWAIDFEPGVWHVEISASVDTLWLIPSPEQDSHDHDHSDHDH
ncbi:MAG: hypothetical protein AAFV53_25660 [Myxococcota bacterium]